MQPLAFVAVMAAALLFGLPAAIQHAAGIPSNIGIFDPLTCAMAYSGQCTQAQMIQHRHDLQVLAAAG